jgi:MoaA/NifB/PqqE/SkfB family radical SAM enzyme
MKPFRITIDTNPDQCNLNCIMCDTHSIYNNKTSPYRKYMSENLLIKSLDGAISLGVKEIIPTTMGEPLLYKYFGTFIDKIKNSDVKLNLTTNGTFPNIGVEKWANKLLPILSDIKISINSISPDINESIMVNDNTFKKIEDIKKFIKIRDELYPNVSITLQVTFLKLNLNSLEDIIKFAISNGINRIKGHQLWITYEEIKGESLQNTTKKINEWNVFIESIEQYKDKIKLVNFNKLEEQNNTNVVPLNYNCPFIGKELWIDYNGDFNVCCAPSQKRKSLGNYGNIKEHTIQSVFSYSQYVDLVKNYKEKEICKVCALRRLDD